MAPPRRRKRLVVAGAGFAGIKAAQLLADTHDVTIVSPKPRFVFLPLVHELLSEETTTGDIVRAPADLVRATYVQGHAAAVKDHELVTQEGQRIPFDALVVAIGAEPHHFNVPGAAEHTLPLWGVDDALRINIALKRLLLEPPEGGLHRLLVVGAGATGLEAATEAAAFFDRHDAPHEVTVLEMRHDIFPNSKPRFRAEVKKGLKRLGVRLMVDTSVKEVGPGHVVAVTKGGQPTNLPSDLTLWCAGIRGRALEGLSMKVDWTLQSVEHPDVFLAGDCARFPEPVPQLAQTAEAQAEVLAHNVANRHAMRRYRPKVKGTIVSLGPNYAVAETGSGKVLAGTLPWHIKKQYYKWTLRRRA